MSLQFVNMASDLKLASSVENNRWIVLSQRRISIVRNAKTKIR